MAGRKFLLIPKWKTRVEKAGREEQTDIAAKSLIHNTNHVVHDLLNLEPQHHHDHEIVIRHILFLQARLG